MGPLALHGTTKHHALPLQRVWQEAEGGNVEMMVLASQMLAEGYGCEPDTQRARQLYQEACAQAQALQPPASRPKQQQQQQQQAPVQAQTQAQAQR